MVSGFYLPDCFLSRLGLAGAAAAARLSSGLRSLADDASHLVSFVSPLASSLPRSHLPPLSLSLPLSLPVGNPRFISVTPVTRLRSRHLDALCSPTIPPYEQVCNPTISHAGEGDAEKKSSFWVRSLSPSLPLQTPGRNRAKGREWT